MRGLGFVSSPGVEMGVYFWVKLRFRPRVF